MPASRQALMSSGNALAVKAMTGTVDDFSRLARIMRVAWKPSISGIRTSIRIRS
jgi:hypothetical protein